MYHNKWILYICGYTHNVNCSNKKICISVDLYKVCMPLRARVCVYETFCQDVANDVSPLKMN